MASEGVNWHMCCLCQTDGGGEMRCPAQSKRLDKGAGYISLSESLSAFRRLGAKGSYLTLVRVADRIL